MSMSGLALDPVARLLLELAARTESGTLTIGGRTFSLSRGVLADISAAPGDESLERFVVSASLLRPSATEKLPWELAHEATVPAVFARAFGSEASFVAARRSFLLDRLIRSLMTTRAFGPDAPAPQFVPGRVAPGHALPLVPFVLDALTRCAGEVDAGEVGSRATERLVFPSDEARAEAESWSRLTLSTVEGPVFRLLAQSPAAAPRIAALVRAGLAQLSGDTKPADAAPRAPSLPPPAAPSAGPTEPALPPEEAPLPPIDLPPFEAPLDDPLDAAEHAIVRLDREQASGRARAAAYHELGRVWQRRHGSLLEAARAFREAFAADPTHVQSARQASSLCAAMGQLDLAEAYASAAAAATEGPAQAECLVEVARLAERAGRPLFAFDAIRAATRLVPENADLWSRLARAQHARGDRHGAVEASIAAITLWADVRPTAAVAECEWLLELDATAPGVAAAHARALCADGRVSAAVTVLSTAARRLPRGTERQQRLLDAAELSETVGQVDLSAELLLEAFDLDPTIEALHDALAVDAEAGLPDEDAAAALEAIAVVAPRELAGERMMRAARAVARMPGAGAQALDLVSRALCLDPTLDAALEALRRHADQTGDVTFLADVLERAVRAANGPTEALLEELIALSKTRLASSHRGLWAMHRLFAIAPSDELGAAIAELEAKVLMEDRLLYLAEQDLESANDVERPLASRRVAALLRDRPDERRRALALYRATVEAEPTHAGLASSLERLLQLMNDDEGLLWLHELRAERAATTHERLRALGLMAALRALRGERRETIRVSERVLALAPGDRLAAARIERAASALGEPDDIATGLRVRLRQSESPEERARVLTRLARVELSRGDEQAAVDAAFEATRDDPDAADAHAILVDHLSRVPSEVVLEVVDRALACLGPSSTLLRRAEELARARSERERALRYLGARARLLAGSPEGARLQLSYALECRAVDMLLPATELALSGAPPDTTTSLLIERALDALADADPSAAATLAVHAGDRLGDARFVPRSLELAALAGTQEQKMAALERRAAFSSGAEQADALRALAELFADGQERAREARSWLRLLALEPRDHEALERLTDIYARTGERTRLDAVLSLRLEQARSREARGRLLLLLTAAQLREPADVERAGDYAARALLGTQNAPEVEAKVRDLFEEAGEAGVAAALLGVEESPRAPTIAPPAPAAEEPSPRERYEQEVRDAVAAGADHRTLLELAREGLERFPTSGALLITFDEAAVATGAADEVEALYGRLLDAAMGDHSRRALLYREARCLERLGRAPAALEAYRAAFAIAPSDGLLFQSVVRLASATGQHDDALDAHIALIDRTANVDHRLSLLRSAVALCAGPLDDPTRAFELLFDAFQASPRLALVDDLRRIAAEVRRRDDERGRRDLSLIIDSLEGRIEGGFQVDDQLRCLGIVAAIHWEDLGDRAPAIDALDRATAIAEAEDEPPTVLTELLAWREHVALDVPSLRPPDAPPSEPEDAALGVDAPIDRLLAALREDPSRAELYGALAEHALTAGASSLAWLCTGVAARFDARFERPSERLAAPLATFVDDPAPLLVEPLADRLAPAYELLWRGAMPLFRRALGYYGVLGTQRLSPYTVRPITDAYVTAQRVLGLEDAPVYVREPNEREVLIAPTHPISVIVASSLESAPELMGYRLGRALALATPARVLVASLDLDDLRVLLEALEAAFGPPERLRSISHPAASLAADLWHTIPARDQTRLRDAIAAGDPVLDAAQVRGAVLSYAARAALLVATSLDVAIDALCADDITLRGHSLSTASGFEAAVRASQPLADVLRMALGEASLGAWSEARTAGKG